MGIGDVNKLKPGMVFKGKFGEYQLLKKIGDGGNGTVFSVQVISAEKQLPEGEKFAIKVLTASHHSNEEREKREKRFEKELQTVYRIQNEIAGIVPIYDASYFLEERGEFSWYLMPEALKYNFKSIRSIEEKLNDMRMLGECIAQLHKIGFVHRDIKHQNLLVYKNRVCLADFGLTWNMNEEEEHITDIHDSMGPAAIRPPELRSIEIVDNVDYRKSDVYLFAKTVWIVLTGVKRGFPEEYRRFDKNVYLDKKELGVETAEPLHEMLELATRHWWWERIDMNVCIQYIDEQLSIITKESDDIALGKWKYAETVKEICDAVLPEVRTFQGETSILAVLERMAGAVNLVFEEAGKVYEPMLLKGVKLLPENLFELEVRNNYYRNKRKMIVRIDNISISKDLLCAMNTDIIANPPNHLPVFTKLTEALQSVDKQICISGSYIVRFMQIGASFP